MPGLSAGGLNMDLISTRAAPIENRTFDEIAVGDSARLTRTLSAQDLELFALAFGDSNPSHLAPFAADGSDMRRGVAPGVWGGALIASLFENKLPGPGAQVLSQHLVYMAPIHIGDTITTTATVRGKFAEGARLAFDCSCVNQTGERVSAGAAMVRAPREKISRAAVDLPDVRLSRHERFGARLAQALRLPPATVAVAHPCDATTLAAVIDVVQAGLVTPILVGPQAKIRAVAEAAKLDISGFRIVDCPHSHAAAARAVALVRAGEAEVLMKGSLHTDELMHEAVALDTGLRTERRVSHAYILDVPSYPRPLFITDAAINIAPTLEDKRDIVQNAIDLAHTLGEPAPKVAILAAIETINPAMRATLDAAALCKMADRGQITGGIVEGPLAFDNAVSERSARDKGILSPVAGFADILVAPDLEAGNMLAKQLVFLAGADAAGVVLGARAPIVLTSRADSRRTKVGSCAVAVIMAHGRRSALG